MADYYRLDLPTGVPFNNTTGGPPSPTPYTLPLPFIVIAYLSSSASVIGTTFIIFVYYKLPQIRTNSRKLLVFLSIADFLNASGNLIGITRYTIYYTAEFEAECFPPETLCVVQSFISTIGNLWSFFWTVCVAIYLYTIVVSADNAKADRYIPVFHMVSWTAPVVIMVLAVWEQVLGEDLTETTPGWCWVCTCARHMTRSKQILWMLVTGKFWEILAFTMSATLYIMIRWTLHKTIQRLRAALVQPETIKAITRVVRKMTFVPLIFFFLRIWGSIRFLLAVSATRGQVDPIVNSTLLLLQSFGDSGQGICNAILYCLDSRQVRLLLSSSCRSSPSPATITANPPKYDDDDSSSLIDAEQPRRNSQMPPTKAFEEDLEPQLTMRYAHIQSYSNSGNVNNGFERY